MKTAKDVLGWMEDATWRGANTKMGYSPSDRATAVRIAQALRVLEAVEEMLGQDLGGHFWETQAESWLRDALDEDTP